MKRFTIALAAATAALCGSTRARASGFDTPQVGSAQAGPANLDSAAVFYNPGQLGFLERTELSLGVGIVVGSVRYQRERLSAYQRADNLDFAEPIDAADLDPSKTGIDDSVRAIPIAPNFDIFLGIPVIKDRFVLGLGIYTPYAAILNFPEDGPQKWQLRDVFLTTTHATLSAAVKLHDVISIGAGVSYVLGAMSLSKVQDFAAVEQFADALAQEPINQTNDFGLDAPSTVRELDVLARPIRLERLFAHGVTFNAGVALKPTEKLDLALVYQHGARMRMRGTFMLDMNDDFFTQDLAPSGLRYDPLVEGDAEVEFRLPKRITAGFGYDFSRRFRLDGFASYVFYQDIDSFDITLDSPQLAQPALGIGEKSTQPLPREWIGVGIVELNGRIRATRKLLVSVLAGYHSPASPPETIDVASPDGHRIVYGAGIGYDFSQRFALLADAEFQSIIPRQVTESDFDLGNGRYRMFLAAIGVHAQFRFGRRKKPDPAPSPQPNRDGASGNPVKGSSGPSDGPD